MSSHCSSSLLLINKHPNLVASAKAVIYLAHQSATGARLVWEAPLSPVGHNKARGAFWPGLKDLLPECGCQAGPGCGWGLGRATRSGSSSYGLPMRPGLPYSTGLGAKEMFGDPRRRCVAYYDFALKVTQCHLGTTLVGGSHEELLFRLQAPAV